MKAKLLEHIELASYLRAAAEHVEKYDNAIWNVVCDELTAGNPDWCKDMIGKSAYELAIIELRRLYAIEKSVQLALKRDSSVTA